MRMFRNRFAIASVVFAVCASTAFAAAPKAAKETALDRYVKKPDATYKWELAKSVSGEGYKTFTLELTSQTWRKPSEVDRTVWKHWLVLTIPDKVTSSTGFLFITGGNNGDPVPEKVNPILADMA